MTANNLNEKARQTPNVAAGQPRRPLGQSVQAQRFLDAKVKQIIIDTLTELNLVPKPENKTEPATTTAPNAKAKAAVN
jgi:hypothetical protein